MPQRLPKPCAHPGCPALTLKKYCPRHERQKARVYDQQRGSAAARGYDARWRRYREQFLREHPYCTECERHGRVTPATVVDHEKPHKGDPDLFWNPANHQPLCQPCHDSKTARQDGRWGR